jgi:puromycin-sensitive aminopeptidase
MAHPTEDRNFRLPRGVRPTAYDALLSVDLDRRAFSGRIRIGIALDAAAAQLVLHGLELEVSRALCRVDGRELPSRYRLGRRRSRSSGRGA